PLGDKWELSREQPGLSAIASKWKSRISQSS
ncbi:hypothetical protein scyTo_0018110, partial [Scyliorhinus torazame]|nr:hypothetical protein [Scyliorhinus torazame]